MFIHYRPFAVHQNSVVLLPNSSLVCQQHNCLSMDLVLLVRELQSTTADSAASSSTSVRLRRGGRNLIFTAISFSVMALLVIVPCVVGMFHVRKLLRNMREREAKEKEEKRNAAIKKHAQRELKRDRTGSESQTPTDRQKSVLDLVTNPLLIAWWKEYSKVHNGEENDEEKLADELFNESMQSIREEEEDCGA